MPYTVSELAGSVARYRTCRLAVPVRLRPPPVAVTVRPEVPLVVVDDVLTVSVVLAPVVGLGLKEPRAPEGRPLTLNDTAPVRLPVRVMVTV